LSVCCWRENGGASSVVESREPIMTSDRTVNNSGHNTKLEDKGEEASKAPSFAMVICPLAYHFNAVHKVLNTTIYGLNASPRQAGRTQSSACCRGCKIELFVIHNPIIEALTHTRSIQYRTPCPSPCMAGYLRQPRAYTSQDPYHTRHDPENVANVCTESRFPPRI